MHKNFYKDQTKEEIIVSIKAEGFHPFTISNSPGYTYDPHVHPETKVLAFLEGSMTVVVDGKEYCCKPFDKLVIPGLVPHSAIIGEQGCMFLWAERIMEK